MQNKGTRFLSPPKKQKTATTKLFKQGEHGQRIECFSKEEVETACIEENYQRFMQNKDTPFLSPPLSHDVGYLAEEPAAEQILQVQYSPFSLVDQYTQSLIQELKLPDESDGGCDNDLLIAQMLQMQFDKEYDQQLAREENHHNGTSKVNGNIVIFFVSLSML